MNNARPSITMTITTAGLVSRPVLDHGFITLQEVMGSDASIVAAARISVANPTFTSADDKLLNYLMAHKHTSPFEQAVLKFHVKAPLFVVRQWQRHRTWSYNEISARYSEMPTEFYIPALADINEQSLSNKQGRSKEWVKDPSLAQTYMRQSMTSSFAYYHLLLKEGVAKEIARIVLPVSTYTEFVATVNLHNLLHFLRLRLDSHAQLEIRCYASAILAMVEPFFPATIQAFRRTLESPPETAS